MSSLSKFILISMLLPLCVAAQDFAAARQAWNEKRFNDAVSIARPLADSGDPYAQEMIAIAYLTGKGVAQDKTEGTKWTRVAAEAGRPGPQYALGLMYAKGDGVPIDLEKSYEYISRSANSGFILAQAEQANKLFYGIGVKKDLEQAIALISKVLKNTTTSPASTHAKDKVRALEGAIEKSGVLGVASERSSQSVAYEPQKPGQVNIAQLDNSSIKSPRPALHHNDPRFSCEEELSKNPKLQILTGKIPLSITSDISFPMLSNQSLPNGKEQQALAYWADQSKKCSANAIGFWKNNYSKDIIKILEKEEEKVMAAAIDLYNKNITFGKFNNLLQSIAKESKSSLEDLLQTKVDQQEQSRARAAAIRDAQQRQEQQRIADQRRDEQRRQAEQAKISAIRQQWEARCELDKRNAYEQYSKSKENACNGTNKGLGVLCVVGNLSAAQDYADAAFKSCMSGAPIQ